MTHYQSSHWLSKEALHRRQTAHDALPIGPHPLKSKIRVPKPLLSDSKYKLPKPYMQVLAEAKGVPLEVMAERRAAASRHTIGKEPNWHTAHMRAG